MKEKIGEKKLGFAGRLANIFVSNKELGMITIIAIFAWGIFSFIIMPKQYNPEIVAPAFNIVTEFSGASSEEVYELITKPMQDKIKELPKVDKIMSQSRDGGISMVTVQYYIGENLEGAKVELSQKLEENIDLKPLGASDPIIKTIDPDNVPIIAIGLSADEFSNDSLRALAFDIKDKLKLVDGTSQVEIKGSQARELQVSLDQNKINAYSISALEIYQIISKNNSNVNAGEISDDQNNFPVKIKGNIQNENDLKKIVLRDSGESILYLEDVADISYTIGEINNKVNFYEKDKKYNSTVYIAVSKLKGANATVVSNAVLNELENLKEKIIPSAVNVQVLRNDGKVASEAVMGLTQNLFTSIAIVSLILFLFLGWRSALVVSISIPLTLATIFGIGNLAGQTVNRITLFALILSLGLLVDSATVVVENILRMLKKGNIKDKKLISVRAVDEVGNGLIMSTVTTVLAFIPMAFISGMMGPYMGPISFFVPVALIISMFVAFTTIPFLTNVFIKKESDIIQRENFFIRNISKVKNKYSDLLKYILDKTKLQKKILIVASILFLFSISLPVLKVVKFRMLPIADMEQFYVYVDLPKNTSFEKTNEISSKIENFILENESEVKSIQGFIGEAQIVDFNGLFKGSDGRIGENQATLKINLTHPDDRRISSEKIVLRLREKMNEKLKEFPDLKMQIIQDPPGPPVLSTFLLKIQGENQQVLDKITKDIQDQVSQIDEIVDVDSSLEEKGLEFIYEIDREKASRSGVSVSQINQTLRIALSGMPIGLYHENNQENLRKTEREFIILDFSQESKNEKIDLENIYVMNNNGENIPFSELVNEVNSKTSSTIFSDQREKTNYIFAEMGDRSVTYGVIDIFKPLLNYTLPSGDGEVISWSLFSVNYRDKNTDEEFSIKIDGEWKLTLEVFRDLGIAMAVAIFLIYFVLVAQFESLKIPLLIMGTIPLSLIGVLPGFALLGVVKGTYFNATSMIGVIALAGIVVNNAIILLEHINDLKKKNLPIKEALLESGKTRFMPILLTSMTTILGSLTIISDPVWEGLAWSIILGLSISSFLTLVIFPILYYISEKDDWR
ncbi:MAG: efflux RND transporter permease subunit [Candidatus Moranbacteria bacterium]|nr:efflux RND transporter permease subunit [Candidatus Moranbacteria bacterium]